MSGVGLGVGGVGAEDQSESLPAGGEGLAAPCLHITLPVAQERAGHHFWGFLPSPASNHLPPHYCHSDAAAHGSTWQQQASWTELAPGDADRGPYRFQSPTGVQQGLCTSCSPPALCMTLVCSVSLLLSLSQLTTFTHV